MRLVWTRTVAALLLVLFCRTPAAAASLEQIDRLTGKYDGVAVADSRGDVVFSKNARRPLVPASTLKILTALTAFHYLSPAYRFPTVFGMEKNGDLAVKGYGDPLLVSEVLGQIVAELKSRTGTVRDILLDDTYFDEPLTIPGVSDSRQPYDAPNGALCANFNTISFRRRNGEIVSAEPQTPLLPFARARIGERGPAEGRIALAHENHGPTRYAGLLLRRFLEQSGVRVTGDVRRAPLPRPEADPFYTFTSPFTLEEVVGKLLAHSNNFMANQILIAAGADAFGAPGNLEKGVLAARRYAAEVLGIGDIRIAEGSGISRGNRLSPEAMLQILAAFEPHRHLMRREGREWYKTGHLKDVATRAGYIEGRSGRRYRYAVMIHTPGYDVGPVMRVLLDRLE